MLNPGRRAPSASGANKQIKQRLPQDADLHHPHPIPKDFNDPNDLSLHPRHPPQSESGIRILNVVPSPGSDDSTKIRPS